MKKNYQKPMVMIENFELSQHIAACMNKVTLNAVDVKSCTASGDAGNGYMENIFLNAAETTCSTKFEDYCYASVSTGNTFLFGS